MKKYIILLSVLLLSCNDNSDKTIIKAKNKTIDSLKTELEDCKTQAKIMANVLEQERIEENKSN
ncbi:hypothetical protein [Chryseobacterium balustinum]|uniref:Lipoprotein n=1 Tax=Chryseobacterium balustinum TaxID=246 RepID=A0AAX2IQA8_9FLAO|nr:hypothetical protein [Chryseobacterium balustinum]AZB28697.1 hypothetical protein EB354_05150 [Chryseobacterium balustinum]SKC07071.1 hypothetical protein SAMN05421800_12635 [Chryseobacterium balustinum]SQA91831.1 Uncharacterised protein [Chryseobacterium balustinum]